MQQVLVEDAVEIILILLWMSTILSTIASSSDLLTRSISKELIHTKPFEDLWQSRHRKCFSVINILLLNDLTKIEDDLVLVAFDSKKPHYLLVLSNYLYVLHGIPSRSRVFQIPLATTKGISMELLTNHFSQSEQSIASMTTFYCRSPS